MVPLILLALKGPFVKYKTGTAARTNASGFISSATHSQADCSCKNMEVSLEKWGAEDIYLVKIYTALSTQFRYHRYLTPFTPLKTILTCNINSNMSPSK